VAPGRPFRSLVFDGGVVTYILDAIAKLDQAQLVGYIASVTIFTTFCMTTMIPLRFVALLSNLTFATYGYLSGSHAVMVLHLVLLPVNFWKLRNILDLVRSSRRNTGERFQFERLRPFMTEVRLAAGTVVFHKGDMALEMYYVKSGEILIEDVGATCRTGDLLGEVALFSSDKRRTAGAVCVTDCVLLALSEAKTKELYFQDPEFSFRVVEIIIERLLSNARQEAVGSVLRDASVPVSVATASNDVSPQVAALP